MKVRSYDTPPELPYDDTPRVVDPQAKPLPLSPVERQAQHYEHLMAGENDCLPEAEFISQAELDGHLEQARAIKDAQAEIDASNHDEPGIGTFACPICGLSTAHFHSTEEVEVYRSRQPNLDHGLIPTLVHEVDGEIAEVPEKTPGSIPAEILPAPKLGEVEIFMPEDVDHALHIFDVASAKDQDDRDLRLKGMRLAMMFALQAATVNLGVKPEGIITERPIQPTHEMHRKIQARAKAKAARKQNKDRRRG